MQSYIGHNPNLARYVVHSSDVIDDMRVNVLDEDSDKVRWYKERFLSDDEIIEHVVDNPTNTICWIVHRPKRGWYIRIRAPTFPPGVFIPFLPVPLSSPNFADAALFFSCRTSARPFPSSMANTSRTKSSMDSLASDSTAVHSYPPTPPSVPVVITPPSPRSIDIKLGGIEPTTRRAPKPSQSQITQFLLTPHSTPRVPQAQPGEHNSFITRALSIFNNHKPSHSASFTLCPLDKRAHATQAIGPSQPSRLSQLIPQTPTPLLTFHDRTPVLTVRSVTGLLEIDRAEERMFGVDTSFWIAVALTYLEFLEDRESYLAALSD